MKAIINVIEEPPAYALYRASRRPEVHWNTGRGSWVGIWGYDWPNQLGDHVLQMSKDFAYEVWQPDLRADRIYTHYFPNGLIHSLFPAVRKRDALSMGRRTFISSDSMLVELRRRLKDDVLIQLNNFRGYLSLRIFELLQTSECPLMITGHGSSVLPWEEMKVARSPATKLSLLVEHFRFMRGVHRVDFVADENQVQVKKLERLLHREVGYLLMGTDFDFWLPRLPNAARLPGFEQMKNQGKTIFLSVGNYIPRKRFDKLIEVFSSLEDGDKSCLVLVGHGEPEYTKYLRMISEELIGKGQLMFIDYARNEALRDIYWSSDIYIAAALSEGTSVAAEYAAACNMPIVSALNNGVADLLTQLQCGMVLPAYSKDVWKEKFTSILRGQPVRPIPLHIAREYYDWANTTSRFIDVYRRLFALASRRKKT
jgi:glycosyltransferase involved in cell wall biosynthesis